MGFYCKEDQLQFEKSYVEILKLFGEGNKSIITAFNNRLKEVNTYPGEYSDSDVNSVTPGKTGYENNPNSRIYIKLIGFDRSSCSKAQTQHYFSHETSHAFSVAAQDVFSNRQRAGIGNYNIPYFYTTRIGNSEYLGISGSIYKKLQPNEIENVIYGGGFCEVMTDLFEVASRVASSPDMKNQGITVDTVLKKPNKEWNKERIISGYFASMPLARLAIAAFSNYPNPQYQHILNTGGSIFSTMRTDTNAEVHINDFIYGSMCDPLYIAEEYNKIAGQPGAYFKLCQPMDKIVDDYAYKRPVDNKDIQFVIQQLSKFAKLRTMIKVQEGVFTQEYADKIYEEFEKVKSDVEREYGLSDKYQQISNQNHQITPTVIAETSKNAINENPGIVAEKVKKSHNIFKLLNRNKDDKRR